MRFLLSLEIGIFLDGVFRCARGQWGELVALAEFVLWNSPGKSGLAPRDLVMAPPPRGAMTAARGRASGSAGGALTGPGRRARAQGREGAGRREAW